MNDSYGIGPDGIEPVPVLTDEPGARELYERLQQERREHRWIIRWRSLFILVLLLLLGILALGAPAIAGAAPRTLPVCKSIMTVTPVQIRSGNITLGGWSIGCGNESGTVVTGTLLVTQAHVGFDGVPTVGSARYSYGQGGYVYVMDGQGDLFYVQGS